jgi:glycerophosphoryl diester phosphodiesterase
MLHIAHRGCIDHENTIHGIVKAFEKFPMVEIDVRYNSERKIVLCHDREKRNNNNECLDRNVCGYCK